MRAQSTLFLELLSRLISLLYSKHMEQLYLLTITYLTIPRDLIQQTAVQMHVKKTIMLKEKITIQKKEALGSQVGPNPESYGSFKSSELRSNPTALH